VNPRARVTSSDPVEARLDDIARLLALLVARDRTLQDAIGEMDAFGIPQSRIAGLVGKSQGYVNVAAERYKSKGKKTAAKSRQASEE
jgi:hypothetical protein